jgi:hypothetical protein
MYLWSLDTMEGDPKHPYFGTMIDRLMGHHLIVINIENRPSRDLFHFQRTTLL